MALNLEAPSVERRLYFPANGKEPAPARPIQVTFDKVVSITTPRICILPAAAYEADGKTPESSAKPSGSVQHQMQLSMGQVCRLVPVAACISMYGCRETAVAHMTTCLGFCVGHFDKPV
jgi:hypothetical protein